MQWLRPVHRPGVVPSSEFLHDRRGQGVEWWGAGTEGGYRGKGELTGWVDFGWGEDGGSASAASCTCLLRGLNGTHCAGEDGWMWADAAGDAVRCHAGLEDRQNLEEEPDDADDPPGLLRSSSLLRSSLELSDTQVYEP